MDSCIRQHAVSLTSCKKSFICQRCKNCSRTGFDISFFCEHPRKKQVQAYVKPRHKNGIVSSLAHWRKISVTLLWEQATKGTFYINFNSFFPPTTSQVISSHLFTRKGLEPPTQCCKSFWSKTTHMMKRHYQSCFSETWKKACVQKRNGWSQQSAW